MTTLTIIVIVALVVGITVFKLPLRLGLVKPATERLLSQTPDRDTAALVYASFQQVGLSTRGVQLYVIPEKKSSQSVLLATLDTSQGFAFGNYGSTDAVSGYLIKLAQSVAGQNINRVAFQYLDSEGKPLVTVTAPVDTILKYSKGQVSQDVFLKAIDAKMDLNNYVTSGLP